MEKENVIPIFFAVQDDYFHLLVAISSIIRHSGVDNLYFIILVPMNFSEYSIDNINSIFQNIYHKRVNIVKIDKFSDAFLSGKLIPYSTYFRLLIPTLFPQFDKVIYLDIDTITLGDINELYNHNIDNFYVAGVKAPYASVIKNREAYAKNLKIKDLYQYINAGVLLLNLKKIRNDKLEQYMIDLVKDRYVCQDQDIINKVFYDNICHLNFKFNLMTKYANTSQEILSKSFSAEELKSAWENPLIIHYADKIKPWNEPNSPYASLWWNEASHSGIYQQILLWTESNKVSSFTALKNNNYTLRVAPKPEGFKPIDPKYKPN